MFHPLMMPNRKPNTDQSSRLAVIAEGSTGPQIDIHPNETPSTSPLTLKQIDRGEVNRFRASSITALTSGGATVSPERGEFLSQAATAVA